jgi:hypothetical protein
MVHMNGLDLQDRCLKRQKQSGERAQSPFASVGHLGRDAPQETKYAVYPLVCLALVSLLLRAGPGLTWSASLPTSFSAAA